MTTSTAHADAGDRPRAQPRGLLLDLDGVIYVAGEPIEGAREALLRLRALGVPHRFVTNTTSRPREAVAERLARMGLRVSPEEILTPPVAAVDWLRRNAPGPVALFVPPETRCDFAELPWLDEEAPCGAAAVVVGDLGEGWDFPTLNRAFRLLMADPATRLVALGMTRYWRAPDGLRLDVAPFVVALEHATGKRATVLGKPAPEFFHAAARSLGLPAETLVMVGDDIVGDVAGAQRAGLRGVLVRTGKFRPEDLEGTIRPDAVLDSIADLPAWWAAARAADR